MQGHNATVSPLLLDIIDQLVAKERVPRAGLAQAVGELSMLFTKKRAALSRPYLEDPAAAAAYLSYFLPVNLSKIQILLDEMPIDQPRERFSVLDLGSGPGTGSLAVLDWHQRQKYAGALAVVAVDSSLTALGQASQLWTRYCHAAGIRDASFQTHKGDLEQTAWLEQVRPRAPFDVIVLANILNEIHVSAKDPIAARTNFVTEVLPLLAPSGTMMIVEPALRETSRALHHVRDRLLREKRCTVYSPCLHENNCPALADPYDWCHEERGWEPPVLIREIDKEVGFIKDALKFSYLLLRKDGKSVVERRSDVYRVVSELREMKGEKRAWLCNETGRAEIGRQDRLASPQNEAFDAWHRGVIVQIERIVRKEKGGKVSTLGRIEQGAAVKIVRPA
jgi:ribosomal protein RSM22 (predicted rRNA methylase)